MTYQAYRRNLIRQNYESQLERFAKRFDPAQPTVVLLPGGMGSQLDRSRRKYPVENNLTDNTVWLDIGIIGASDATKLEVVKNTDDDEADIGSHVIGANGPVHFLTQTPYDEFLDFARQQKWNVVVFGYDWRRPLKESADLLRFFIESLRKTVETAFPKFKFIPTLTLVAHSMGGTVLTLALRDPAFGKLPFNAALTVATPFYGTSTHQDRYFKGEKFLNLFYGAELVADLISTLPGPYSLMFLPKAVFDRDAPNIDGLSEYPQIDWDTGGPADPYNPAFKPRWRPAVRKHMHHIAANRLAMMELTKPLFNEARSRVFNVRAVGVDTATRLYWKNINGNDIDPNSGQSPLVPDYGEGDGTVPAWSAYHAYSLPQHRRQLKDAKDHGLLFEHPEVWQLVASIVTSRRFPARIAKAARRGPPAPPPFRSAQRTIARAMSRHRKGQSLPPEVFKPGIARAVFKEIIW